MRAVFNIPIQQKTPIRADGELPPIFIGKATVTWQLGPIRNLLNVVIDISGFDIRCNNDGIIQSSFPEFNEFAYRVAVYLANIILIQTAIEAFDPSLVFRQSPELFPENDEEKELFSVNAKEAYTSLRCELSVQGRLKPTEIESNLSHSIPISHYAEAIRQSSPFLKYEQFYKVTEYYFPKKKGEKTKTYDSRINIYATSYNSRYTLLVIKKIRQTRNRCIHPRADLGHLSPEDLKAIREVKQYLPVVKKLANILLMHPPSLNEGS